MAKRDAQPNPARRPDGEELPLWPHQVQGGKYVKLLQKFVRSLRDEDGQAAHGNQALFLDDVLIAYLLAFYNASVRSLRTIEDFSRTKQAQRHLTVRKICKSTLSDFNALADPERLQPLIEHLREAVEAKRGNGSFSSSKKSHDKSLSKLLEQTVAVDGTFLPALADVAWSVRNRNQHGSQSRRARVDVFLNVQDGLPEAIVVPEPKQGEADLARHHIQPGKIYLYDRGYNSLPLVAEHFRIREGAAAEVLSEFVLRLKGDDGTQGTIAGTVIKEQALSDQDCAAGVVQDRIVRLRSENAIKLGLQNIMPILRDRERQCALARESQRRRNARKKASKTKSVS